MFNPHDKNKVIDLDTNEGVAIFMAAARKQAAYSKGGGLGRISTLKLLERVANLLRYPAFTSDDDGESIEEFLYEGCVEDAGILDKAVSAARDAEKRGSGDLPIYEFETRLKAVLLKLHGWHNPYAIELLNRIVNDETGSQTARPGEFDDKAAREHWHTLEREARAGGFRHYADHFERIARHPAAGELLAPEYTVVKRGSNARVGIKPKPKHHAKSEARDLLERFEYAMANRGTVPEDDAIDAFADQNNLLRKILVERVRKARESLAKEASRHAK